eukprot:6376096-Pyramimonas_sp.AAC.1
MIWTRNDTIRLDQRRRLQGTIGALNPRQGYRTFALTSGKAQNQCYSGKLRGRAQNTRKR